MSRTIQTIHRAEDGLRHIAQRLSAASIFRSIGTGERRVEVRVVQQFKSTKYVQVLRKSAGVGPNDGMHTSNLDNTNKFGMLRAPHGELVENQVLFFRRALLFPFSPDISKIALPGIWFR